MMTWVAVCGSDELPEGEARILAVDPPIAVFNTAGAIFAIDDLCTHDTASLADGWIEEDVVECPFHQARFCLRTGKALSLPATRGVRAYASKVEAGSIFVDVPDDR